jgi:hypothetical protein
VAVELGGHRERIIESLAGDEAVRNPAGHRVLSDLPLEPGTAGGPHQEPVDHRASYVSTAAATVTDSAIGGAIRIPR